MTVHEIVPSSVVRKRVQAARSAAARYNRVQRIDPLPLPSIMDRMTSLPSRTGDTERSDPFRQERRDDITGATALSREFL